MSGERIVRTRVRSYAFAFVLAIIIVAMFGACGDDGSKDTDTSDGAPEVPRIAVEEVKARMDSGEPVFFIDTRSDSQWDETNTKLPGALHVPPGTLDKHLSEIPQDRIIVTYCT